MLACVRRNCPTGVLLRGAADAYGVLGTVDGGFVIAECEGRGETRGACAPSIIRSVTAQDRLRELSDFAAPWAVWIAATLRLPDHIEAGAARLEDLSDRARTDPDALSRLLLDEGGWRQWLDLDGAPGVWAKSWTRLLDGVRTGSPGRDEGWFYDELARTGRGASFDALMAAQVQRNAEQIAARYDWRSVERVVDVGGGTGVLLRTLLATYEHLHGTLFDLPQVVESVEPAERLTIVPGNMFDDTLPAADAY